MLRTMFDRLYGFLIKTDITTEEIDYVDPSAAISNEIDMLWSIINEKEPDAASEEECLTKISESFTNMLNRFPDTDVTKASIWPRYAKAAISASSTPVKELVDYVNADNYKSLCDRLKMLSKPGKHNNAPNYHQNYREFAKAVYLHILDEIDPDDVPSNLALGDLFLEDGEYGKAREYFSTLVQSDSSAWFNGLTALIASYQAEIKSLLANGRDLPDVWKRVNALNKKQFTLYEKYRATLEIAADLSVEKLPKRQYVCFIANYARALKYSGQYQKAMTLLEAIPEDYPETYRTYIEKAMIYQAKPYRNPLYSLDKTITTLIKADEMCPDEDVIAKKAILMPLANTYFTTGQYDKADEACLAVLRIDKKEYRAHDLRKRIAAAIA